MSDLDYSYGDARDGSAKKSLAWNAVSLVGRQSIVIVVSILLARLIGPHPYGIVSQGLVLVTFATLLLDQGLTASLISQRSISRKIVSSAAGLNLILSAVLGGLTAGGAAVIAAFFRTPELKAVMVVLGVSLIFKGLAIVPRMVLMRTFRFRAFAICDVGGALLGAVSGVVAASQGFTYWSVVIQLVASDVFVAVSMLVVSRAPLPSFRLARLRPVFGFGLRVFGGNVASFASRNVDNAAIGRVLGAQPLALYSIAYRVLLAPVQMIGQVVSRVLFPAIARASANPVEVQRLVSRSVRGISLLSFPLMGLVAASADETVGLFLGADWRGAVPVLQVLALTGARQAVTSINAPILLGMGRADRHFSFNLIAAGVQVAGILIGLNWGIVGVAVGYTVAGLVLQPYIWVLQRQVAGLPVRQQVADLAPAFHATCWAVALYVALKLLELPTIWTLVAGTAGGTLIYAAVIFIAHRSLSREVGREVARVAQRLRPGTA